MGKDDEGIVRGQPYLGENSMEEMNKRFIEYLEYSNSQSDKILNELTSMSVNLAKIKNWIALFGVLTLIGLFGYLLAFCGGIY